MFLFQDFLLPEIPQVKCKKGVDLAEGENVAPASSGAEDCCLGKLEQLWLLSREDSIAVSRQPGVRGNDTEVLPSNGNHTASIVRVGGESTLSCSIVVVGQALICNSSHPYLKHFAQT